MVRENKEARAQNKILHFRTAFQGVRVFKVIHFYDQDSVYSSHFLRFSFSRFLRLLRRPGSPRAAVSQRNPES